MAISVVLNTKNSVKTLERAIRSVAFADEVIVVDMQSTDGTPELAKQLGASIFYHKDVGYVEPARQFAIGKARNEWVLILDADEVIPKVLAQKLVAIAAGQTEQQPTAYALPRKNKVFGEWLFHAGWWPDYQIRFFRKGSVVWPEEIHSVPEVQGTVLELPVDQEAAIEHYNYDSISSFIQRLDRYTTVQATLDGATESGLATETVVGAFRKELLRRVFAEHGIDGGSHAIAVSLLQAFSETVRQLKRWELGGMRPKKASKKDVVALDVVRGELAYWIADYNISHTSGIEKLWWIIRRKLQV